MKKPSTPLKYYNCKINCCRAQQYCQKVKFANGSKMISKVLHKLNQCQLISSCIAKVVIPYILHIFFWKKTFHATQKS